jgi:hypothetical protein
MPRGRRDRWRDRLVGVAVIGGIGGICWLFGHAYNFIVESIVLLLWYCVRGAVSRREWPRLKWLGAKTRIRCTCDQCERLRAEEFATRRGETV